MVNQEHIRILYEVVDKSAELYQKHFGITYLEGIVRAAENVVADAVLLEEESLRSELEGLKALLGKTEFQQEEIRKAMQLAFIKGLKAADKPLETLTPEAIGIFVAYLISRFHPGTKELVIFDPLVGLGNLLATIANNLEAKTTLFGVDHENENLMLCRSLMGMLEYEDDFYYQDTLSFTGLQADVLVADVDRESAHREGYFPYVLLKHHSDNLKPGALVFIVIFDDFFAEGNRLDFKDKVLTNYDALGLIRLPEEMFKKYKKNILILRKKNSEPPIRDFLMAAIPSFDDKEAMQDVIGRINDWFGDLLRKDK